MCISKGDRMMDGTRVFAPCEIPSGGFAEKFGQKPNQLLALFFSGAASQSVRFVPGIPCSERRNSSP